MALSPNGGNYVTFFIFTFGVGCFDIGVTTLCVMGQLAAALEFLGIFDKNMLHPQNERRIKVYSKVLLQNTKVKTTTKLQPLPFWLIPLRIILLNHKTYALLCCNVHVSQVLQFEFTTMTLIHKYPGPKFATLIENMVFYEKAMVYCIQLHKMLHKVIFSINCLKFTRHNYTHNNLTTYFSHFKFFLHGFEKDYVRFGLYSYPKYDDI